MDRRTFLGNMGLAVGAVVATTMVPLSVIQALPTDVPPPGSAGGRPRHADDVWGHWPPYSHPIPYGRQVASTQRLGLDYLFRR